MIITKTIFFTDSQDHSSCIYSLNCFVFYTWLIESTEIRHFFRIFQNIIVIHRSLINTCPLSTCLHVHSVAAFILDYFGCLSLFLHINELPNCFTNFEPWVNAEYTQLTWVFVLIIFLLTFKSSSLNLKNIKTQLIANEPTQNMTNLCNVLSVSLICCLVSIARFSPKGNTGFRLFT